MGDGKQHINPWADKLQDISLPDEGLVWEGMSARLDNELPQAKKNDRRRWVLLIILLLLLLGVCNCPRGIRNGFYNAGSNDTVANGKLVDEEGKSGTGVNDSTGYLRKNIAISDNVSNDSDDKYYSSDTTGNGKYLSSDSLEMAQPDGSKNVGDSKKAGAQDKLNGTTSGTPKAATDVSQKERLGASKRNNSIVTQKPRKNTTSTGAGGNIRAATTGENSRKKKQVTALDSSDGNAGANIFGHRKKRNKNSGEIAGSADAKVTAGRRKNNKLPNNKDVKEVSVKTDTGKSALPVNDDLLGADSATVKAQKNKREQIIKDSTNKADSLIKTKDIVKKDSLKTDSAKAEKKKQEKERNKENGWAAGVGFNQFFAISGQQRSTLNSDGVTGTWKDYLPVPQLRYYFNRKLYVQLEAQFNAPQYTQTLLGKFIPPDTSGNGIQTSVFVKKLFYFNLPLSVHYSPFKNFYVGTGIQFSRLSNGVGTVEEQRFSNGRPDSTGADIKTQSLKSESLYRRISTNEFRWLVDANYHLKNFTIGARYNQAFSNFINIQVSSTQLTQARNSSLQLYLRYTFWRSKKLKENGIY